MALGGAGGVIFPQAEIERICAAARERDIAAFLDGARLWNVAIASGRPSGRCRADGGTFVNSEKVAGTRVLVDGDTVRFGKVLLTFNMAVETRRKDTTQPELKA